MIALSGGVDSAVAAFLLKEQGYEVAGVTMCLGVMSQDSGKIRCCGPREIEDARRVCDKLDIAHHVIDFAAELQRFVIQPFIEEYRSGRTPNPCVECNRRVKFGVLLDMARSMGFDYLATGHYAVLERSDGVCRLKVPQDRKKDQSYFLSGIPREALEYVIFPLSDLTKEEVREIARRENLPVFSKPDSQDICFIPKGNTEEYLKEHLSSLPGDILDQKGNVIGRHRGLAFYTIGQRARLSLNWGKPLYVTEINTGNNSLTIGSREHLLAGGLIADSVNLLSGHLPERACAKIRYAHAPAPCRVAYDGETLSVAFDEPQEAVTPGQTVVIYGNDYILASGIIREKISL
jgi:tRNA-specific 2-thiouridylase